MTSRIAKEIRALRQIQAGRSNLEDDLRPGKLAREAVGPDIAIAVGASLGCRLREC